MTKHARKYQENSNTNTSNYDCICVDGTNNFDYRSICSLSQNKGCKDIQFQTFESNRAITIGTSEDQYSVGVDYYKDTGGFEPNPYFKNVAANDPTGDVLLSGGEAIIITLQSSDDISSFGTHVTLYDNKVSDCDILLGHIKDKDKVDLNS